MASVTSANVTCFISRLLPSGCADLALWMSCSCLFVNCISPRIGSGAQCLPGSPRKGDMYILLVRGLCVVKDLSSLCCLRQRLCAWWFCVCVCIGTQKHALDRADRAELLKETKRRGIAEARRLGGTWLHTRHGTCYSRAWEAGWKGKDTCMVEEGKRSNRTAWGTCFERRWTGFFNEWAQGRRVGGVLMKEKQYTRYGMLRSEACG
jgi:hypothetical protein